jgi:hypothetical protein
MFRHLSQVALRSSSRVLLPSSSQVGVARASLEWRANRWHGKQIPKRKDTLNKLDAMAEVKWDEPIPEEELALLPDIRNMTNEEWLSTERHKDTQVLACFHQVYPDILEEPLLPDINFLVQFTNRELVYRGNWLSPELTLQPPKIAFEPVGAANVDKWDTHWTVIMVDADEPSRDQPDSRSKQHWLVVNIPAKENLQAGKTLVEYLPPLPYKNSGAHRYVLFLCRQEKGLLPFDDFPVVPGTEFGGRRANFDVNQFTKKYGLAIHSYVFFQSEWDDSVSKYFANLGIPEPVWETNEAAKERRIARLEAEAASRRQLERIMGLRADK